MPRTRLSFRLPPRWARALAALLAIATLAFWFGTSKRAWVVLYRIAYALLLALPPVLLIGGVLTILYYLNRRGPDEPRSKPPPRKRR